MFVVFHIGGVQKEKKGRGNEVKLRKEIAGDYKSEGPYGAYSSSTYSASVVRYK